MYLSFFDPFQGFFSKKCPIPVASFPFFAGHVIKFNYFGASKSIKSLLIGTFLNNISEIL